MRQRAIGILGAGLLTAGIVLGIGANIAANLTQTASPPGAPSQSLRQPDPHLGFPGRHDFRPGPPSGQHH